MVDTKLDNKSDRCFSFDFNMLLLLIGNDIQPWNPGMIKVIMLRSHVLQFCKFLETDITEA